MSWDGHRLEASCHGASRTPARVGRSHIPLGCVFSPHECPKDRAVRARGIIPPTRRQPSPHCPGQEQQKHPGGGGVPQAPASLAPTVLLATSEPCCAAANKPQTMGQDCGGQWLCPLGLSPTSRGKGEPRERTFLGGSSTCPALGEHPQAAASLAGHGFIPSKICHEANPHCLPADPARHVAAAAPSSEAGCSELQLPAALGRKGLSRTVSFNSSKHVPGV